MKVLTAVSSAINRFNFMRYLKMPTKMLVLGILALGLAGFLLFQLMRAGNSELEFNSRERLGTEYLPPLYNLLTPLQQHRTAANLLLSGDDTAASRVSSAAREVDAAFMQARSFVKKGADPFALMSHLAPLENQWNNLKSRSISGSQANILQDHGQLVDKVKAAIVHVADDSNLTLDPELDTYYLMDIVAFKLHELIDTSSLVQAQVAGYAFKGSPTFDQKIQLRIATSRLADLIAGVRNSYQAAVNADGSLTGKLGALLSTLESSERAFSQEAESATGFVASLDLESTESQVDVIYRLGDALQRDITALNDSVTAALQGLLDARVGGIAATNNILLVEAVVATLLVLVVLAMVAVGVVTPLNRVLAVLERMAQGNLENELEDNSRDEMGELGRALMDMQQRLRDRLQEEARQAEENARVSQALDSVSGNVMIADKDYNIIYMNPAILQMMRNAQPDIRKDLHGFDVDKLIGQNIDGFHKDPAHQRAMLDKLTDTFRGGVKIGGRTFTLVANPIVVDGERAGTVVEWADRTGEVAIEAEIDAMVDAASVGDFTRQISLEGKSGFFANLSQGLNNLVSTVEVAMNDVLRMLGAMSRGDLTERMTRDYQGTFGQLKDDANRTADKLTEVITNIRTSAGAINSAANEIAQGNADLSQRTEEQASSLEETASSMEEMTSTVKQSSENAQHANELSAEAQKKAEHGGEVVGRAVYAMEEINRSSKEIADIIGVIDEIAFQTNLLALNAAVEAARAGEQGRGFAVVAGEVRNLAQRSAGAAKEIKELIRDSQNKVGDGTDLVNQSGDTLKDIVASVAKVSTMMRDISEASREQTSGIEQVNTAVSQMDDMTQQNAALVEEASAAGEAMAEQARSMNSMMDFFSVNESAAFMAPATSPAPATVSAAPEDEFNMTETRPQMDTTGDDDEWEEF